MSALLIVLFIAAILRIIPVIMDIGINGADAATHLCYLKQNRAIIGHILKNGNITPEFIRDYADQIGYLHSPTAIGVIPWLDRPLHNLSTLFFSLFFGESDLTILIPAILYSLLIIIVVYLIAEKLSNKWVGIIAASLTALSCDQFTETLTAMAHIETNLLLLTGIYLHLIWDETNQNKYEILAAIAWGLAVSSHPDVIPFLFFYLVLEIIRTLIITPSLVLKQIALIGIIFIPIIIIYDALLWMMAAIWGKETALSLFISDRMLTYQKTHVGSSLFEGLYIYLSFSATAIKVQLFTFSDRLMAFIFGKLLLNEGVFFMLLFPFIWIISILSPFILYIKRRHFDALASISITIVTNILFLLLYNGVTTETRHLLHIYYLMIILLPVISYILISNSTFKFNKFILQPKLLYIFIALLFFSNMIYVYPLFTYQYGAKQLGRKLQVKGISKVHTFSHSGLNVYLPAYGIKVTHLPETLSPSDLEKYENLDWVVRTQWANETEKNWDKLIEKNSNNNDIDEAYLIDDLGEYLLNNRFFNNNPLSHIWRNLVQLTGKKVKSASLLQKRLYIIKNSKLIELLSSDKASPDSEI
ncbi:glycosyltransferase family 39 protein [candidate division KSB1 bacterium]|nr:glycosyltransferase family 39 protein [candidate division KSB1 bacterium]